MTLIVVVVAVENRSHQATMRERNVWNFEIVIGWGLHIGGSQGGHEDDIPVLLVIREYFSQVSGSKSRSRQGMVLCVVYTWETR